MSPQQLRKFLDGAELSQSEAARELELDPRTLRRYVAGDLPIPKVVELALQGLMLDRKGRKK
jgi:hypothetical protein